MKLLMAFSLLLFLNSCDGPYSNCIEYYFDDDFKSLVLFNDSSYWVYEDRVTGEIDTITLISSEISLNDYCDPTAEYEQFLDQLYTSTKFSSNNEFIRTTAHASAMDYNTTGYNNFIGLFMLNQMEEIDTFTIKNEIYKGVLKFINGPQAYYWVKDIGVIRKDFIYKQNGVNQSYQMDLIEYEIKE